ncbi:hypothetical protein, partial [Microbispora bryophytorum]|uniref:hypothetical protein n=1 Tax=Microbispora bryophytorum TaxID=1460882 RepID=UPI0033CC2B15
MGPSNFDPDHLRRLNNADSSGSSLDGSSGSAGWWDRLTSGSRLWSADGSAAREHFPIADPQPARHASRTKADSSTSTSTSGLRDGEGVDDDASGVASADSAGAGAGAGIAGGGAHGSSAGGAGGAGAGSTGG